MGRARTGGRDPWYHLCLPAASVPGCPDWPPKGLASLVSWASRPATHRPFLPLASPTSCPFQEQPSPASTRSFPTLATGRPLVATLCFSWHLVPAKNLGKGGGEAKTCWVGAAGFPASEWSRQGDLTLTA